MRRPVMKLIALFGVVAGVLALIAVVVGGAQGPEDREQDRPAIGASTKPQGPNFSPRPDEASEGDKEKEAEEEEEAPALEGFVFVDPSTVPPTQAIKGSVKDPDGEPIAGAQVYALKSVPGEIELEEVVRTLTKADGTFYMGPVEGRLTIDACAEGMARHRKYGQAGATVDFKLGPSGILCGTVKQEGSEEPCAEALVRVYMYSSESGGGGTMRTDGGGAYRFADLPPGSYTMNVYAKDSPMVSTSGVEVKEGEETVRDILVVPGIKVLGKITETISGKPIVGAEVSISSNAMLKAKSDAEGKYELMGFGTVRARVNVKAKGYLRSRTYVTPNAEGGDITQDIKLRRGGSASGKVLDPTGKPVAGAKVSASAHRLFQGGEYVFTTADDGTFLAEGLNPGQVNLYAYATGFAPGSTLNSATVVAGEVTPDLEIRLKVPGNLTGKVLDALGEPIDGVNVQIWPINQRGIRSPVYRPVPVQTQADGVFTHPDLASGTYGVRVEKKGYTSQIRQNLVVSEGGSLTCVDFTLQKGSFIAGKVVDTDGKPVAAATVRAHAQQVATRVWQRVTAQTKEDGTFRLEGLQEGTYYLRASKTGLGTAYQSNVATGTELLELKMRELNTITGTVVLTGTGKPAAAFKLAVYQANNSYSWPTRSMNVADATGKFKIKGLGPGAYDLEATTKTGLISERVRIEVREDIETPPTKLVLDQGPVLKGLVQTPDGRPASGATVYANPSDGQGGRQKHARTDKEGRFVLAPLRPGTYAIRVTHNDWVETQDIVGVTRGMESTVTLALRAGGSVLVIVTDPAGDPVAGASVSLKRPSGSYVQLDWNKYRSEYMAMQRANPGMSMGVWWSNLQKTDDFGCCVRLFLPPERLTVLVSSRGRKQATAMVDIHDGRETTIRIKVEDPPSPEKTDEERKREQSGG
jgi:protocatechuate 3,4-dioxygenase beta subunit